MLVAKYDAIDVRGSVVSLDSKEEIWINLNQMIQWITPAFKVGTVQTPLGVLKAKSFQQQTPWSLIFNSGQTVSQGFFFTFNYAGGFLT